MLQVITDYKNESPHFPNDQFERAIGEQVGRITKVANKGYPPVRITNVNADDDHGLIHDFARHFGLRLHSVESL